MRDWIINHFSLLCVSVITILTPICPLMLSVSFLIIVDLIFGVSRSIKLSGYKSIESRKMRNGTLNKIVLYNLAIITVYVLEKYIIQSGLPVVKITACFIGLIEVKSIDENFTTIFGWSFWGKLRKIILRGTSETKDLIKDIK